MKGINKPFYITWERLYEHQRGNKNCPECWQGYPQICPKCGGLLHAEFEEEHWDDYSIATRCESCEDEYK